MRDADRELFDALGAQLVLAGLGGDAPKVGSEYAIEGIVGAGGFGLICKAVQVSLHRRVALKLYALAGEGDAAVREALREARSLARLEHPGIVGVHAAGEGELVLGERRLACAFIELQFVEGETLRAWLGRPRDAEAVVQVLLEAGRALAHAHAQGVVHRDFKPENVMVDTAGHARVIDFGLALAGEIDASSRDELGTRATSTGLIRGTPGYMAPEASQGLPRAASDQFAFAVVVREALTGRHPFREGTRGEPARGGEALFAKLRPLIDRAMSPSPDDRLASVDELCDAIAGKLARKPKREPGQPRSRVWPGLGVLAVVGAGVLGVVLLDPAWPWSSEAPPPSTSEVPEPAEQTSVVEPPAEPPPAANACEALREWTGTWQLGGKVLWTEYAYQLDWWLAYELELELRDACELHVVARRFRPLVAGEPRGEPVVTETSVVAVHDGEGGWLVPLELGFAGDTNTYGNDERYRVSLRLDHAEGAPRLAGGFARFDSKDYPIRTGKLLGSRELTPTLAELADLELDCGGRCRSECAGERAVQACIARACEPTAPDLEDACGPPSVDFKPPLRASAAKRTLQRGESLVEQSIATGSKATLLSLCTSNAGLLAGRWVVEWSDASAATGRISLELSAQGCTLSGTATSGTSVTAVSGEVTAAGTWSLVPTTPSPDFPSTLVLVGVGREAPSLGIDLSESTRELRAYRVRATHPTD